MEVVIMNSGGHIWTITKKEVLGKTPMNMSVNYTCSRNLPLHSGIEPNLAKNLQQFFSNFHTTFDGNRRSHIIKIKSQFYNLDNFWTLKPLIGIPTIFNPLS